MSHIWRRPIELALLTAVGLISALLGTGFWHWLAWFALAVPILVAAACLRRAFRKREQDVR